MKTRMQNPEFKVCLHSLLQVYLIVAFRCLKYCLNQSSNSGDILRQLQQQEKDCREIANTTSRGQRQGGKVRVWYDSDFTLVVTSEKCKCCTKHQASLKRHIASLKQEHTLFHRASNSLSRPDCLLIWLGNKDHLSFSIYFLLRLYSKNHWAAQKSPSFTTMGLTKSRHIWEWLWISP